MPYNVFLIDIMNRIGSDERRAAVQSMLQQYFDPIAKKANFKDGSAVQFVTNTPKPLDFELVAYYGSSAWHVVSQMPGGKMPKDAEGGGLTVWNGKVTASDVSADTTTDTRTLANLTFHELMHNKLHMGEEMHGLGGLAAGTVDSAMRPSEKNNSVMSAALRNKRPQWTDGVQAMLDRNKKITI